MFPDIVRQEGVLCMHFIHESNRVYVNDDRDELIAEVTFPNLMGEAVVIDHTYVSPGLRGGGVASQLMEHAYDEIKGQGKKTYASCPYAVHWFERNKDKRDILLS